MHLSLGLLSLCLVAFIPYSEACAASGICGLQPYCYGSTPGYGQYPSSGSYPTGGGYQQPAYANSCGRCATSYGCGQYGCYRMRAAGSNTFSPERARGRAALRALERARANRRDLSDESGEEEQAPIKISAMDNLAFVSPTAAKLRSSKGIDMNPNRAFLECCMDRQLPDACLQKCNYNVYTKDALSRMYFKQDACPLEAMRELQFCAAQGGDHRECCVRNGITTTLAGQKCLTFCDQRPGRVTQLDMSYIPCFDRFESMKQCFWTDLTRFRSRQR